MGTVDEVGSGVYRILLQGVRACYLVRGEQNALVDSGLPADAPELVAGLVRLGLQPAQLHALLLTHVHADHGGGAGPLALWNPRLLVYAHERGVGHLADPSRLAAGVQQAYGPARFAEIGAFVPVGPPAGLHPLSHGQRLDLGGVTLQALETPGHAKHHVVFWEPAQRALFSGDALGSRYPGLPSLVLSPPAEYDPELAKRSIAQLAALGPRTAFFAHNGPFPVGDEPGFFERLAHQHDDWVEAVADVVRANPAATREQALEGFLDRRPELRRYAAQYFSFGLSVAGILAHLKRKGG